MRVRSHHFSGIHRRGAVVLLLAALLLVGSGTGCGRYGARRLAQAPNTYPRFLAPPARVTVDFGKLTLTNVPVRWVSVGPHPARLRYRIIPPGDYQVRTTSTNWFAGGRPRLRVDFRASFPGAAAEPPRGTIVLLHGFGIDQRLMIPWALLLAQEGWQCVLVDLRGHGRSTGRRIYFGTAETQDMEQLLDDLQRRGWLTPPVGVMGDSYGASLALRWAAADARIDRVVAVAPYPELAPAAQNLRGEFAPWFPSSWLRSALGQLPGVLGVPAYELDPIRVIRDQPVAALFVAGENDRIAPPADVSRLRAAVARPGPILTVPDASHEGLPYRFEALTGPVIAWFDGMGSVAVSGGVVPVGAEPEREREGE